jgi:hypothetical protein
LHRAFTDAKIPGKFVLRHIDLGPDGLDVKVLRDMNRIVVGVGFSLSIG